MSVGRIEFFFDIGSPYTYLAFHRLAALDAAVQQHIEYRPFLLGAVFKAVGNTPPAMIPSRGQYMLRDLNRWAERLGIPFSFPPFFPINSLLPMRALCSFSPSDLPEQASGVFHGYWAENRDVSQPEVLTSILGAEPVAAASRDAVKQRLRANTEEAVARGAFGAPTFFVGQEMFFGNDRIDFVLDVAEAL